MFVNFDFEVYSDVLIDEAPLDVYASHPSTRIILAAYAFDDGPVKVWEPSHGPCPEFRSTLSNPDNTLVAWNVNYERTILAGKGFHTPIERWLDPMAHARYVGLPGKLKKCAEIPLLGIPAEEKTKNETLLIKRFCTPDKNGRTLEQLIAEYPEDWNLFVEYCRKDVLTMRHVHNWLLPRFPFPVRERQIWLLDQTINQRGLPVDVSFASAGTRETSRLVSEAKAKLKEITSLENPNSVEQLLEWLKARGYKYDSLPKELVAQAIEETEGECKAALEIRKETAKSSVKKFAKFVKATSPDGRARDQFVYAGAHTLRWSGRDIQPHNLPRKKTDTDTLNALLEMTE